MRIAFLGNLNNYTLPLCEAMRRLGHDALFVLDSTAPLHRPDQRYPELAAAYDDWIVDVAPFRVRDIVLPTPRQRRLRTRLRDYPYVISTGFGVALAEALGKRNFIVAAGADLDIIANPEAESRDLAALRGPKHAFARFNRRRLAKLQRQAFRRAVGVDYYCPGTVPHGEVLLDALGVRADRRHAFMTTDLARIHVAPAPKNSRLRILSGARQCWVEPLPPGFGPQDNKRNDILIRGAALFARDGTPFDLRLPEKGNDLAASRALVDKCGLSDLVTWLPEMNQAAFAREMMDADIVTDHFGSGGIGMVVRDAMAMGRPVVAKGQTDRFRIAVGEPLPIADAASAEDVAAELRRLRDPAIRADLAARGREFAERHFSPDTAAKQILAALAAV